MKTPAPFMWSFCLSDEKIQFRRETDGVVTADTVLDAGCLTVTLKYSWKDEPLCLSAEADSSCAAEIVFFEHRIELKINGTLSDEEWPVGEPLFYESPFTVKNVVLTETPVTEDKKIPPCVTGSFEGAEGWCPGDGVFVGDCMPYSFDGRFHLMYLRDRHHHGSKWGRGAHQWGHISSDDLISWDIHPTAVGIDSQWEGSICTGSWIFLDGVHYLYYTVRTADGSPAPICRSVSDDGYHFTKDESFRFTLSDRYKSTSARDPKVIKDADGRLHMLVTTTDLTQNRGCLAHLVSSDGESFAECGNIYTANNESEPECPDYFFFGGKYYLLFSHGASAQYRLSDKPFSGFTAPDDPTIPCASVPKCAVWNGRILFAGFRAEDCYAGTVTFCEAHQLPDGTLSFGKVPEMETKSKSLPERTEKGDML